MIDEMNHKNIKPDDASVGLLHAATLQVQFLSKDEQHRLEAFRNVTVDIPQQFMSKLTRDDVGILIRSVLHVYGQHRWYQAKYIVGKLMKKFNYGYWVADNYNFVSRINLDFHGISVPEMVFFLRYAFIEDIVTIKKFTKEYKYDLIIVAGSGYHRQGHQKEYRKGAGIKGAILHELSLWPYTMKVCEGTGTSSGRIIIPGREIQCFTNSVCLAFEKERFFNKQTDTCRKFHQLWTDHIDTGKVSENFLEHLQ